MSSRLQQLNNQVNGSKTQTSAVTSNNLPTAVGPYSHAVAVSGGAKLLFVSGQLSRDPKTSQFVFTDDIGLQTEQVLKNLQAVLKAGGSDLQHVVKCTVLLDDMAHFNKVNEVYGKFFNGDVKPARACFAVKELPAKAKVEIECIAVIP